jgi:N-acetylglucosaminyldiphosphoundecaprenol N-acetyl-beta-D-mannosaminyltransferase
LTRNRNDAQVVLSQHRGPGISIARSCAHVCPIVHEHVDVLGVKISAVDMDSAVNLAIESIEDGDPAYVCAASVHGVMEAQRDPGLLRIFNRAAINIPDGMPLTWVGWLQGFTQMDRVFGPDFMLKMCRISLSRGYRHFLYGGNPGVAEELSEQLQKMFPGLEVAGTYTPPFRSLNPEEEHDVAERIWRAKPDILWVGIGAPKQERFMAEHVGRFNVPLMVGVGAAFDFHTGRIADCPDWVKRAGLQWLHRLKQEPGRLWKRYLVNNPVFLWRVARQLFGAAIPGLLK